MKARHWLGGASTGLAMALLLGWANHASAQPWHGPDSIPVFRRTDAQERAAFKLIALRTCSNHLRALSNAARTFAYDHGDQLPAAWSEITNRLSAPEVLYCPADPNHPAQTHWAFVNLAAISYEIVAPGADRSGAVLTYARCKVHAQSVTTHGTTVNARPYDPRGFPVGASNSFTLPLPVLQNAKGRAASVGCVNQLKQLGLAARAYANDHADFMPSTFEDIAPALTSLSTLVCPADLTRAAAVRVDALAPTNITYHLDAPGIRADSNPNERFISCPLHDNHVNTDGSVTQGARKETISGHPLSWTVEPGRPLELAVLTSDPGRGPFRFQWRRLQPFDADGEPFTNTVVLVDATNRTHRIEAASATDEGYYDVIVSDAQGLSQLSSLAYLRVEPVTNVSSRFNWDAFACFANLHQIALAARMYATDHTNAWPQDYRKLTSHLGWPLSVHCPSDIQRPAPAGWEAVDFDNLSYTLETALPPEPGTNVLAACKVHHYRVQANGAVSTGETPPAIFWHPDSLETFVGRSLALRVGALGEQRACQWYRNNEPLAAETNSTLNLPALTTADAASYHAVLTNPWGSATSQVAVVTVNVISPARLEALRSASGAELELRLAIAVGVECRIEASPDLRSWTPLVTNVPTDGAFRFQVQPDASRVAQFYRATLR